MNSLKVFYKNNNPIIAIPVDCPILISFRSINCFSSFTLKRKMYKVYLYIYILIYFLTFKFSNKPDNNLEILLSFYDSFSKKYSKEELYTVFIWSTVEDRNRYYVHLLDKFGNKVYFVKITTNIDDYALIEIEYNNLISLEDKCNDSLLFKIPKVIDFEKNDTYCSLVVETLEKDYKLFHPEHNNVPKELIKSIQGKISSIKLNEIYLLDWYVLGNKSKNIILLKDYIYSLDESLQINLALGHGDFGGENIFQNSQKEFSIIDWERSNNKAPVHLDIVSYWLGKNHYNLKFNENATVEEFYKYFINYKKVDVALALIFLVGVNFDLSFKVANRWDLFNKKENF